MTEKGNRLKNLVVGLGMTNKELAHEIEVQPNYISMIITGKKNLSASIIQKLCSYNRNINPEWLENGVGGMFIDKSKDLVNTKREVYLEKDGVKFSPKEIGAFIMYNEQAMFDDVGFKLWFNEKIRIGVKRYLAEHGIDVPFTPMSEIKQKS